MTAYFTDNFRDEIYFYGSQTLAIILANQIVRLCYEVNCIIEEQPYLEEEVTRRLQDMRRFFSLINQTVEVIFRMDSQFWFDSIRIYFDHFGEVEFEGCGKHASLGGTGGLDPSFQIIEKALGISFEGNIGRMHERFRTCMAASHNRLINHMQEKSLIREYCACSPELAQNYNQLLESYVDFHKLHGTFIRVFLACRIPVQTNTY